MNYIHYGHKCFDRALFKTIENVPFGVKPEGGLWASPINAERGWERWCGNNGFMDCQEKNSFKFTLKYPDKVLHIYSQEDLNGLPKVISDMPFLPWVTLDFEEIQKQGYDAIELHLSSDSRLYWDLYGWDCDSILIMNPDIIQEK